MMIHTTEEIIKESKTYRGNDWSEIYDSLGIDSEGRYLTEEEKNLPVDKRSEIYDAIDEEVYNRLRVRIDKIIVKLMVEDGEEKLTEEEKKTILACRAYTWAAGHGSNHYTFFQPLWRGLSLVTSDMSFLDAFGRIFPLMWD